MAERELGTGNAAYNRIITVSIVEREDWVCCNVCGADDRPVIYIESSEGEYGGGQICEPCCTAAFKAGAASG